MTTTYETLAASFRAAFDGEVSTPGDAGYEAARSVWNATVTTRPAVVAPCRSTADIVAAVTATRRLGLPVAIRAGGHSVAGFSSCEGGVVLDLTQLRGVDVDAGRRRAVVQPGATWADFDAATGAHGLASTGGLISTTGVAGLTLGGGIGWLQRKYGLACDNLRAAQLVTADGSVVDADDDLLWGLRGGGGNFGVVSRFEFDLHPVATVLGGLMMWPLNRGEDVLRAFRDWAVDADDEASLLAAVNTAPPEPFVPAELVGQKVIALVGCWCGDAAAGREALAPLRALQPAVDLFGPMPYPALQGMLDAGAPSGLRNYFRGGYLSDLGDEVIATAIGHGSRLRSPMSQIHFHHMGGAVARAGTARSSFSGRRAGYTFNLIATWTDPAEDAVHRADVRELSDELAPSSLTSTYLNFDTDGEASRVRTAFGDDIYDRLARLKREYDPTNLFRRNQNVLPAR